MKTFARCEVDDMRTEAEELRKQLEAYRTLPWEVWAENLASLSAKADKLDRILWALADARIED